MSAEVCLHITDGSPSFVGDYSDVLDRAQEVGLLAREIEDMIRQLSSVIKEGGLPGVGRSVLRNAGLVTGRATSLTIDAHGLVHATAGLEASAIFLQTSVTARRAVDLATTHLIGTVVAAVPIPALSSWFSDLVHRQGADLWDADRDLPPPVPGLAAFPGKDSLYEGEWIADGVVPQERCLLRSLPGVLVTAPIGLLPAGGLCEWTEQDEGLPLPHMPIETLSADTMALGQLFGLFSPDVSDRTEQDEQTDQRDREGPCADDQNHQEDDGPPVPDDHASQDQEGRSGVDQGFGHRPDPETPIPNSCSSLLCGVHSLARSPGCIRVFAVPQPEGKQRWVVELAGLQFRTARPPCTDDEFSGLQLLAGESADLEQHVVRALCSVGVEEDEPVLLAGHSQSGLLAACLAKDVRELNITHVITAGAPSAWMELPPHITLVSVEHPQDHVVRVLHLPEFGRVNRMRLRRDPTDPVPGKPEDGARPITTARSHGCDLYAVTARAIDESPEPRFVMLRAELAGFFRGDHETLTCRDIDLNRIGGASGRTDI
ncbi:MAG: hypothetical protein QG608_2407 [Actinomycetota bacterium]|nr:hypothetical protein [Actinomycetota bacterium]